MQTSILHAVNSLLSTNVHWINWIKQQLNEELLVDTVEDEWCITQPLPLLDFNITCGTLIGLQL